MVPRHRWCCHGLLLDETQQAGASAEREREVRRLLALRSPPDDPIGLARMLAQAMASEATFTSEGDYLTIHPASEEMLHTLVHNAMVAVRERRIVEFCGEARPIWSDTHMPAWANPYGGERPEISETMPEACTLDAKIDRHAGPWQQPGVGEQSAPGTHC